MEDTEPLPLEEKFARCRACDTDIIIGKSFRGIPLCLRHMTATQRWRARVSGQAIPLRRRTFSKEEDYYLRQFYPSLQRGDGTMQRLMQQLGRDQDTIEARAKILGLTKANRSLSASVRLKIAQSKIEGLRNHPRMFERIRFGSGQKSHTAGHRADLEGKYFRSQWEANYARYLTFTQQAWEYEPKTFWFLKIKRGVRSYTPDFYLPHNDCYHEVKGWMDPRSHTKLKRMRKYYPHIRIVVIGREFFSAANKQGLCRLIPHWECNHKRHKKSS